MNHLFDSLRVRLLLPLVVVSVLASFAVAIGSYVIAVKSVARDQQSRFDSISETLTTSSFPLTLNVLDSIATLTKTELITTDSQHQVIAATISTGDTAKLNSLLRRVADLRGVTEQVSKTYSRGFEFDSVRYTACAFRRTSITGGLQGGSWVVVLFDEAVWRAEVTRAVAAPLATGMSSIALFSLIATFLISRLIVRLGKLQSQVQRIAGGEFETRLSDQDGDELGRLADSVNSMATQLGQMWQSLHRQEGERLLHQMAAGLAHNLRNSLAGARLAIELHQRRTRSSDDELPVALRELEQSELYIKRLILVAAGQQETDRPSSVRDCVHDMRQGLDANAEHLGVSLLWSCDDDALSVLVSDGPSFSAAVTNLVFNAIQSAMFVEVKMAMFDSAQVQVRVLDNGPGPSDEVKANLFEPFVTTKPEGMGLGLALVKRAAKRLGGDVRWHRETGHTVFTLKVSAQ